MTEPAVPLPPATPPVPVAAPPAPPAPITYADFSKLDLRVGEILEASLHPKADRLLVLKVKIAEEVRQVVAGIRSAYDPTVLAGRRVVVVANLAPAVIRGVESQGMLLAADLDGKAVLLAPDREVPSGSKVK